MAETGYNWGAFSVLQNGVTLTQGGTVTATSDPVDLNGKAACEVSVAATYSNHAKATSGLTVYVLRSFDGTNYQVAADLPWGVEMVFTQNASNYLTFSVDPRAGQLFKLLLVWGNTTGSSAVTVTTRTKTATVPKAT